MGYDTSHHPVDIKLIETRLLPYIAGHGADTDLDDLIGQAVALRQVRFRAKAWAIGARRATQNGPDLGFEPMLHVWGRPFFIVADTPEQVADAAVRYLATPVDQVDALAREMLARLDPDLVDRVEPDRDGHLPDEPALAADLSWRMRVLRGAAAAVRAGRSTFTDPDTGRDHDPRELLRREVPFSVVHLSAALTPGWMDRGKVWPNELAGQAGLAPDGFGSHAPFVAPLRAEFADLTFDDDTTIYQNYTAGGYVAPERVADALAFFRGARDRILAAVEYDGAALSLRKIEEALTLAQRLGMGFVEATEIYSGMSGDLN